MRVALIHDWLNGMRGGERVLEVLCREFPDAPIHTLIHERDLVSDTINAHPIKTSWFQRHRWARKRYRWLLPLMPGAVKGLRPRDVDAVISLSHCVAKGVPVPPGIPHLCYCFTPMRYIWDQLDQYVGGHTGHGWVRPLVKLWRPRLRRWDIATAQRLTRILTLSDHIADKIKRFWGCEARVVPPPINTAHFTPSKAPPGEHYLVASAMVPYKRIDLAIRAANEAKLPLRVVGEGPEIGALRQLAGPTVTFTGWVTDDQLRDEYRACRALLFPGEEDFGLVPVEAMACGRPVIALRVGGVLETVVEGETGLFFDRQTPASLIDAVRRFETMTFDPAMCRARAERHTPEAFQKTIREEIELLVKAS